MPNPTSIQNKFETTVQHQEDNYDNEKARSVTEVQIEHVPEGTASPGKALFMLLKAFVGTGVIFLPGS
jgi:hypothetical protein